MVDNLYAFALTDSGRGIGDTTVAAAAAATATEAAATAAEKVESVVGDATNAPIAAAATELLRRFFPEQLRVTLGRELCRMQ